MSNDDPIPLRRPDNLAKFASSALIDQRFGGADPERLLAFEGRYNVKFSDAYRNFLLRENGLDYHIPRQVVAALTAEEQRDALVLCDINTLFGIGNGHPYFDLEVLAPNMEFHDYELTPFAHVLGLGGDFCTLVEITQGAYKGRIIYTDGELRYRIDRSLIDGKSIEQIIDYFIQIGYYDHVAHDFADLMKKYARLT